MISTPLYTLYRVKRGRGHTIWPIRTKPPWRVAAIWYGDAGGIEKGVEVIVRTMADEAALIFPIATANVVCSRWHSPGRWESTCYIRDR